MKKLLVLATVAVSVAALSACSSFPRKPARSKAAPVARVYVPPQPAAASAPAYRVGVSSTTVEQLAKTHACNGGQGAALVGEPGPVEVYRMQCADGKVFTARCELHQCQKM